MHHPIYRIIDFEIVGPYTLRIHFDDGVTQTVNLEPVLVGELYGPLRDPRLFRQVTVDPEAHTLVWPNGADFEPSILHDWPQYGPMLAAQARKWAESSAPATPSVSSPSRARS